MSTIPIRDVSLFVKVIGQGDPLLLMHGGPGLDHTTLLSLAPLAERFSLIFYDHRCNGRSSGAAESMTWANLTADAEALRQTLGFDRWVVLGHSFGGMVAQEYALRYPERVSRLVLMDTCGDGWWVQRNGPELLARRGFGARAVQAARRFYNGRMTPAQAPRLVMRFLGGYFYHLGLLDLPHAAAAALRMRMRPEAMVVGMRELYTGWSVMDRLHEIEAPTLVLAGRHDFLSPSEHLAIVADRLPHAQLEIIERAGHNPHDERPGDVIPIIRRFLATADEVECHAGLVPGALAV